MFVFTGFTVGDSIEGINGAPGDAQEYGARPRGLIHRIAMTDRLWLSLSGKTTRQVILDFGSHIRGVGCVFELFQQLEKP